MKTSPTGEDISDASSPSMRAAEKLSDAWLLHMPCEQRREKVAAIITSEYAPILKEAREAIKWFNDPRSDYYQNPKVLIELLNAALAKLGEGE